MEIKDFRREVTGFLLSRGFKKSRSYYLLSYDEISIVIGLQKSHYAKGYYINIGYLIRALNPALQEPRDVDGDVRARFGLAKNEKASGFFDLTSLSNESLIASLHQNMDRYVNGIISLQELTRLLTENPHMAYQTKVTAKRMLGLQT